MRGIITDGVDSINVSQDYLDVMKGMPMPLNRWAGTNGQFFQWKLALGEAEKRISYKN